MLSKIVSISLLVIANLILLAHDVIPHHHHDDHVCFEHGSCAAHHSDESENEKQPSDENKDEACCSLADLLIIPAGSRFEEINCSCCPSVHDSEDLNLVFLKSTEFDNATILRPLLFRQHTRKTIFYLAFSSLSAGLRAPPVL